MIYIGSDHAGFKLKQKIRIYLAAKAIPWEDLGAYDENPSDFPDIAKKVAKQVVKSKAKGILCCGTGIGMCMAANRIRGARATTVYDKYTAIRSVRDDNANILCLRGRNSAYKTQLSLLSIWLKARFMPKARYIRRIRKLDLL